MQESVFPQLRRMQILFVLILSLAIFLNSSESSSPSHNSPDVAAIPEVPQNGISHSPDRFHFRKKSRSRSPFASQSPAKLPTSEFHSAESITAGSPPARSPSEDKSASIEPPARCIVPPSKLPSNDRRGYGLEYLKFIRLTSRKDPHRVFKFQRYTFPVDENLKLRLGVNIYEPMTRQEQIVLSTSNGDVYAILESTNLLAGIYVYHNRGMRRIKINIETEMVTLLTTQEVKETQVGSQRPITGNFKITLENHNSPYF